MVVSILMLLTLPWLGTSVGEMPAFDLFWDWRLPRTLNAWLAGASLGVAGVITQTLTRNPLADPYILGITSAAALGTVVAMMLNLTDFLLLYWLLPIGLSLMVLMVLLWLVDDAQQDFRLLMIGIAVASLMASLTSLILILAPENVVQSQLFFLFGQVSYDLSPSSWGIFVLAVWILYRSARNFDLLGQSFERALVMGVKTKKVTRLGLVMASLLSVIAVMLAGPIGMVGFLSGHVARQMVGALHQFVILASAMIGGFMVIVADTMARTAVYPQEIPVGIILNVLALPLYMYVLRR